MFPLFSFHYVQDFIVSHHLRHSNLVDIEKIHRAIALLRLDIEQAVIGVKDLKGGAIISSGVAASQGRHLASKLQNHNGLLQPPLKAVHA